MLLCVCVYTPYLGYTRTHVGKNPSSTQSYVYKSKRCILDTSDNMGTIGSMATIGIAAIHSYAASRQKLVTECR